MPLGLSNLTGFNAATAGSGLPTDDPDLWLWVTSDYGITYEDVTFKMRYTDDWLDRSGNGRHLSSDISRYTKYKLSEEVSVPMPSGKPIVRFDPTDPGGPPFPNQASPSSGALANLSQNCTIYMLVYHAAYQWPKYFFDGGNTARANTAGISMQPASPNRYSLSSPLLGPSILGSAVPVGEWMIITAKFDGANSTLQFNNLTPATGDPTDHTTIDPLFAILGGYSSGTYQAQFDCGGCIISNTPNSEAIQTLHKNYLADYAGITI